MSGITERLLAQLEKLTAQNEALIAALVANQPVEVIRAMNPPPVVAEQAYAPAYVDDAAKQPAAEDPWGDETVPLRDIRSGFGVDYEEAQE